MVHSDIQLQGARLRALRPDDAASMATQANQRAIWRNLRDGFPSPYTEASFRDFLQMLEREAQEHPETHGHVFAIEVDGQAVGACGVRPLADVYRRSAEVGYWLGLPFHGRGLATQALRAVTSFAFTHLEVVRLQAAVYAWNPASARVLEKCGYHREAVHRRSIFKDGQYTDEHLYVRFREGLD